jgi:hypothetical protein
VTTEALHGRRDGQPEHEQHGEEDQQRAHRAGALFGQTELAAELEDAAEEHRLDGDAERRAEHRQRGDRRSQPAILAQHRQQATPGTDGRLGEGGAQTGALVLARGDRRRRRQLGFARLVDAAVGVADGGSIAGVVGVGGVQRRPRARALGAVRRAELH